MINRVPPPESYSFSHLQEGIIGHSPTMGNRRSSSTQTPPMVEALLSDWFEAPTLLFSSGRAACHIFLTEMGLHRYEHTITVPAFLSRCILNALTLNAFPVRGTNADAALYYHQYGFRLLSPPREGIVVEDACHAFFSRPTSGARQWRGQAIVISLPKFFPMRGPAGALVLPNRQIADRIRARREDADEIEPPLAAWRRQVIMDVSRQERHSSYFHLLESAYALLTEYPKVDHEALAGFPTDRRELAAIGEARRMRLELLAEGLGDEFPHFLFENGLDDLPYALPYFGTGNRNTLRRIDKALSLLGISSGIYSVDTARSLYHPAYRACVLLPCHQDIALQHVKVFRDVVREAL